jgi:phosphatidate phosphatase PAH1
MAKKRTSLDALFNNSETIEVEKREVELKEISSAATAKTKEKVVKMTQSENLIIKQTVYLPAQVHEQLRSLAFEERKKMHDFLVEGLDRVFKNRGLKSFSELAK